jgi:hypothetical protein
MTEYKFETKKYGIILKNLELFELNENQFLATKNEVLFFDTEIEQLEKYNELKK